MNLDYNIDHRPGGLARQGGPAGPGFKNNICVPNGRVNVFEAGREEQHDTYMAGSQSQNSGFQQQSLLP